MAGTNDDVIALCRERLPALFDAALARLRERAARGARYAATALDDRLRGRVACRLRVVASADVFLVMERGGLRVASAAGDLPVLYALSAPAEVLGRGFAWLDAGAIHEAGIGDALLRLASAEAATLFQRYPCACASTATP